MTTHDDTSARQRRTDARVERARALVAAHDASTLARQRRASLARARQVTAARIALARVIETALAENALFADQLRRRALRILHPDEFNLVARHMDEVMTESGQRDDPS